MVNGTAAGEFVTLDTSRMAIGGVGGLVTVPSCPQMVAEIKMTTAAIPTICCVVVTILREGTGEHQTCLVFA